jgi:hypothetical protein
MKPTGWGEQLLSFAICVVGAVLLLRYALLELQPLLPFLLIGSVIFLFFKWRGRW